MPTLPLQIPNPIVTTYFLKTLPPDETTRGADYLEHQHGNMVWDTSQRLTIGYRNPHQQEIAEIGIGRIVGASRVKALKGAA